MVQNYLSISGTVQSVQGNDAKAPYAYWDYYTYRSINAAELTSLIDGDYSVTALSLSPGQYTCLEISFDEPIYASQFRCYLGDETTPIEVALTYPHRTENPDNDVIDLSVFSNISREDVKGDLVYYDRLDTSRGYLLTSSRSFTTGGNVQLISSVYTTVQSGSPTQLATGKENKTIKQIIKPSGIFSQDAFTRLELTAAGAAVDLDSVSIAPVVVNEESFHFDRDTRDYECRDELRWWYSDDGVRGHFEGRIIALDTGTAITGTWDAQTAWKGARSRDIDSRLPSCSVRQLISYEQVGYTGDGLRVTLSGSPDQDVEVSYMSYMPSNSSEVRVNFESNSSVYREDIKHGIVQWKRDGEYSGHFEGAEVDIDSGEDAIMYSANVIGIPATNHGLEAGDYIRIEGTEFYDGYYNILTFSTPHIIVILGIYDPETFTDSAKIRRVISLGPHYDAYGVKPDARAVVPLCQVNFVNGQTSYIESYTSQGRAHGAVRLGPEDVSTINVESIYETLVDEEGWITNTPGFSASAGYKQSIPNPYKKPADKKWKALYSYDDSKSVPDIGNHAGGYGYVDGGTWRGDFTCISESQDPDYEGDLTGWDGVKKLFDGKMAQPLWTLVSPRLCPWISISYRGPIPVKFVVDLGEPRLFNKYRFWIQTVLCALGNPILLGYYPPPPTVAWPKSWRVEASDHGDNLLEWDVLDTVINYPLDDYIESAAPPDNRLGLTCAESEWQTYRNTKAYRYYRFYIYDSWTCHETPGLFECSHIDEIDFVEHQCSAGIFPVVVENVLYMDKVSKIIPDEHLSGNAKILYAFSFDGGESFEVYRRDINQWVTIVRNNGGQWQYFNGSTWFNTDADKPEENTVRFALWYAFSVRSMRMDSDYVASIPELAYSSRLPNGGYLKFAAGLVSDGKIEAALKGFTVQGTVFNPDGIDTPSEITFNNGQSGCTVPAGGTAISDYINDDVVSGRDLLFVMDLNTTASSVPYFYDDINKYFFREGLSSYYLQTVNANYYTMSSGVVLIDQVEVRQSDTVTLPSTDHGLEVGAYIRVSGTFNHYDGYHYIKRVRPDEIEIPSKHWTLETPVPSGAVVQRRYSIGYGHEQPHVQLGSILKFSGVGTYTDYTTEETDNYPYYWVTSNVSAPGWEPVNLFDYSSSLEFHSGQPMRYGPVMVGLSLNEPKIFDRYRFKSSSNESHWEAEYPSLVSLGGSNDSNPSLSDDSDWVTICSGTANLPIGSNTYSEWNLGSNSAAYKHYRFKMDSNRGNIYDAVRLAKIELSSVSGTGLSGFTSQEVVPGFSGKYLFDGRSDTEYAAVGVGQLPSIHLDLRERKRAVSRIRFRVARDELWTGEAVVQNFIVNATDTFPKILFSLPAGVSVLSITVKVITPFYGGYYGQYNNLYSRLNNAGAATSIQRLSGGGMASGRYVTQLGKYTSNALVSVKWKLAHRDNDDQFDIIDLGSEASAATGAHWFVLPTYFKTTDAEWYPSFYSPSSYLQFWNTGSHYTYWKSGDHSGNDVTGWTGPINQDYGIAARYSTTYDAGIDSNHGLFIAGAQPMSYTDSEGWSGSYSNVSDVDIKLYRNATAVDTEGSLLVEVVTSAPVGDLYYAPQPVFPKSFLLSGSNEDAPGLNIEADWSSIASFDYGSGAPEEGAWGSWLSVPSGLDYDPYKHYRVKFLSNMAGGGAVEETYTVDLTESMPYTVFTLPAGSILYSIDATVNIIAKGGYSEQYREFTSNDSWVGGYDQRISWHGGYVLKNNRYVTQAGAYFKRTSGHQVFYNYCKVLGNNRFDVYILAEVDASGANDENVPYWSVISPTKIPLTGSFYLGIYQQAGGLDVGMTHQNHHWKGLHVIEGNNQLLTYIDGSVVNASVRYGNYYSLGDSVDSDLFISQFQPYGLAEQKSWSGVYGPFASDKQIRLYVDSIEADTQGEISVKISRSAVSSSSLVVRAAECDVEMSETMRDTSYIAYNGSFPAKLMDLPPWHQVEGVTVNVMQGFKGGYAEQAGYTGTGTFDNSFWTVVDRHWQLENRRAIARVGVYSDTPTTIYLKLFKIRTGTTWFDISEIESLLHTGSGFQWFELSEPHVIPDDGVYHLGWWQSGYPVKMADNSGTGAVSYEYGNLTGTNINLPHSNSMRPCLAIKYAGAFTLGINDLDDVMQTFSPVLDGHLLTSAVSLGPYPDTRGVYLYNDSTMVSGNTQGLMSVGVEYSDISAEDYGLDAFTVIDNTHLSYTRSSARLFDTDRSTDFFSYKKKGESSAVHVAFRFDEPVRVVAFRYRPSTVEDASTFPNQIEIRAYEELPSDIVSPETEGAFTYLDGGYLAGSGPDYWGSWSYTDDYVGDYRYFIFGFSHPNNKVDSIISVGDLQLKVEYQRSYIVTVSDVYNTITSVEGDGLGDAKIELLSHAGNAREIESVYNTFSNYGRNELSPSTYFYHGENTPWSYSAHPESISVNGSELVIVHPKWAGMGLLAWHPLSEESGSFYDISGNDVTATRVGTVNSMDGKFQSKSAVKNNEDASGNINFTLRHHLSYYTVAFWFMPRHDIYDTYERKFDIMGGWISYGAIPGVWHISMSQHFMYETDPYPAVQPQAIGYSGDYGRMVFGNYGARLETSRQYWRANSWYHVAFAFRPNATQGNPYICWINGVRDTGATFYGYDLGNSVYPPPDVIMVDPADIHYTRHNANNCMYFGLPLEDGAGDPYEFSLQHVMHFNKVLTDDEVFEIFRTKPPLTTTWDGVYFDEQKIIKERDTITIDFSSDTCITRYGLIIPSGVSGNAKWIFAGSGTQGRQILHQFEGDLTSVSGYYNLYNPRFYPYYTVEMIESTTSGVTLDGFKLVEMPKLLTVSGTYDTVTSGVQNTGETILDLSANTSPAGATIGFSFSIDDGQTWWARVSGTWVVSSGGSYSEMPLDQCALSSLSGISLYTRHEFVSGHLEEYPSVESIDTTQTVWDYGTPSGFIVSGLSSGSSEYTDWIYYSLGQSPYHFVIMDLGSSNGNPSFSNEGNGFLEDGVYVCSGTYLISLVESRENDVVSIPTSTASGINDGSIVKITNTGVYTGYRTVAGDDNPSLVVHAPYYPYQVPVGASYQLAKADVLPVGYQINAGDYYTILSTSGSSVLLDGDPASQIISTAHSTSITPSGVYPLVDSVSHIVSTSASGYWNYNNLGRISNIVVNSEEPADTYVFHAVSFDGGITASIWDTSWVDIIRLEAGNWQYYDSGWINAATNTLHGAFRQAIEDASQLFSTPQLEAIEEADWHGSGAVESTSGTIGFISYMVSYGDASPSISGYSIYYATLGSGMDILIPDGYSHVYPFTSSGIYIGSRFVPETTKEIYYDRKLVQELRVYLANPSAGSVDVTEAAMLDCTAPDDGYYLDLYEYPSYDGTPMYKSSTRATDRIYRTGGLYIEEGFAEEVELVWQSDHKKLYYTELRAYYDSGLGSPTLSGWQQGDGYLYSFQWSNNPIETIDVAVANTNTVGDGAVRIHEIASLPLTYSGEWNVENNFNLIETAHTTSYTSLSGLALPDGFNVQLLTTPHLERLIDMSLDSMPLFPGYGVLLESDLNEFGGRAKEIRFYVDTYSGVQVNFLTQISGSSEWLDCSPTWNGQSFSYLFHEGVNVRRLRTSVVNTGVTTSGIAEATYDDIRLLRALQLINDGTGVDFGTTGTGIAEAELPTRYAKYDIVDIYNSSSSQQPANARVLPRYSGNYELDRAVLISGDRESWTGVDTGIKLPEDYPWEAGVFDGTRISNSNILLQNGVVSGTWKSPIIEVLDPSSNAAYVYVNNSSYEQAYVNEDFISIDTTLLARAHYQKPMQLFLVTAVDTDNDYGLQAPWKISLFRSDGTLVAFNTGSTQTLNTGGLDVFGTPRPPRRYWSTSVPYLWQFYGALDSRGHAGVSLGLQFAGDVETSDSDVYKFYRGFPSTGGPWDSATWGSVTQNIHIFDSNWLYLPIFNRALRLTERVQGSTLKNSWQMVDVVYRPEPFYELYQEGYYSDKVFHARNIYSFNGSASTPEYNNEIDYLYSFEGTLDDLENDGIRCAACIDSQGEYYWMHYACDYSVEYYRTLLINETSVEAVFTDIERKFNFMVESGPGIDVRGFWGITETGVYWYSYDGTDLTEQFGVTDNFTRIHHGCTDFMNNLWFVDLANERVVRVNYSTRSVDYSRVIEGVASVACDLIDGSAYVYVIRAPEFPNSDCIKLVSTGDYDFLEPEVVCKVPSVAMLDSFNINLIARSYRPSGYYNVLPEDILWGEGAESIPWVKYSAGSPTLPKGIYKQFKLTLQRDSILSDSPELKQIRLPVPAVINKIPYEGSARIFVDTLSASENPDLPAGNYTIDLLIWWVRE